MARKMIIKSLQNLICILHQGMENLSNSFDFVCSLLCKFCNQVAEKAGSQLDCLTSAASKNWYTGGFTVQKLKRSI
ncbi:hypothetical protein L1987_18045 [Smallanthus sonchifolius]|uniref:Uncharacterized protein n=1 Tax=Smallanthus sonchifolius TaxID=185202 RepID=A0ACB9J0N1_9ASTR|nr:hypothetical protein L1987_18045 [Smallanthus sonchifolius]